MPSTRKLKANEKRSRQSDVMSDVGKLDVKIGSNSRKERIENFSEVRNVEVDLRSDRPRPDWIQNSEDVGALLNSNSRENCETTKETARIINSEVSRRIDEHQRDINS